MIEKVLNLIKKYKLSIIIALVVILIGLTTIICLNKFIFKNKIKKYENDYYILKYDNSWNLKTKKEEEILLKNSNNAKILINIVELSNESKYLSIDNLIEEILYNIEEQNKNYKLLSKIESNISLNEYKGYKLLYENGSTEVMSSIYKKSDKLIMINYEAKNEYFDILLDSVENIIYNFDTKEETYDLSYKINIDNDKITYSEDNTLDNALIENKEYEIANNNYYVKYSIPGNFELSSLSAQSNSFSLKDIDSKNISIYTYISSKNIYDYLDKDTSSNVYSSYKSYETNSDYSNYKESLIRFDSNSEIYLYKNSYNYDKAVEYTKDGIKETSKVYENCELIYALNKNHIFVIKITARESKITKKLIDSIKLLETKNYSSYTTSKVENNLLVGTLKRYSSYKKDKIEEINIKLPTDYKEIQNYNDVYSERKYGLNYDEENDIYDYEINYTLTSTSSKIETQISSINNLFSKAYGKYNYLTKKSNISVNNHVFEVYDGGFTQLSGIMFTSNNRYKYYTNIKTLFLKLDNGGYLVIKISGNGKEITKKIIEDATNFEIKEINN